MRIIVLTGEKKAALCPISDRSLMKGGGRWVTKGGRLQIFFS
jgi:hypothetical protein